MNLQYLRKNFFTIAGILFVLLAFSAIGLTFLNRGSEEENSDTVLGDEVRITATIPHVIKLKTRPEKRLPPVGNDTLEIYVEIRTPDTTNVLYAETVITDMNGEATLTPISSLLLPVGQYDIAIKGLSHLRKIYENVPLGRPAYSVLDLTIPQLKAGDSHPSSDNYINSLDIGYSILYIYTSDLRGDLNRDTAVNSLDLSNQIFNIYETGDE